MRIIAGRLGGRQFNSPKSGRTHPMSDKMRGALFNTLGDIEGLTILDAFAGTGALSFEAISRGAQTVLAIEKDVTAQKTITASIEQLGIGSSIKFIQATAHSWLTTTDTTFDVVLCDPPYNDLQLNVVEGFAARVKPAGILVISWPGDLDPPDFENLEPLSQKNYGDAQLVFYRRIS